MRNRRYCSCFAHLPGGRDKKYGTATYLNYTYLGNGKVEIRP